MSIDHTKKRLLLPLTERRSWCGGALRRCAGVALLLVALLGALCAAYWRYGAPLAVSGVSTGWACPVCAAPLQGPWVRIEIENEGWLPVVVQAVFAEGPGADAIVTIEGVVSNPAQAALSPYPEQVMQPYRGWAIPASRKAHYALHLAFNAGQRAQVPRLTQVRIRYTIFGLPFALVQPIDSLP